MLSVGPETLYADVKNLATSNIETKPFQSKGPVGINLAFTSNPDCKAESGDLW